MLAALVQSVTVWWQCRPVQRWHAASPTWTAPSCMGRKFLLSGWVIAGNMGSVVSRKKKILLLGKSFEHISQTFATMFSRPRMIRSKKKAQKRKRRINQVKSALRRERVWPSTCKKWLPDYFFFKEHVKFIFLCCRTSPSYKKEDKKLDKPSNKDKDLGKKQEAKGAKTESGSSEPESSTKDERKHWRKCFFCLFFSLSHLPAVKSFNSFSPSSRTQEPRQDGNGEFQERRSQLFQTQTFQKGTIFWKGDFFFFFFPPTQFSKSGNDGMILKRFLPLIF